MECSYSEKALIFPLCFTSSAINRDTQNILPFLPVAQAMLADFTTGEVSANA